MKYKLIVCVLMALMIVGCKNDDDKKKNGGNKPDVITEHSYIMSCGHLVKYDLDTNIFTVTPVTYAKMRFVSVNGNVSEVHVSQQLHAPNYSVTVSFDSNYYLATNLHNGYLNNNYSPYTISDSYAVAQGLNTCADVRSFDWLTFNGGSNQTYSSATVYREWTGVYDQYNVVLNMARHELLNHAGKNSFFLSLSSGTGMFNHLYISNTDYVDYDILFRDGYPYIMVSINGYRYVDTDFPLIYVW